MQRYAGRRVAGKQTEHPLGAVCRWEQAGVVRQTLRNWALTALAGLGVHPNRLARHYPHLR